MRSRQRAAPSAGVPKGENHDLSGLYSVIDVVPDSGQVQASQIEVAFGAGSGAHARLSG